VFGNTSSKFRCKVKLENPAGQNGYQKTVASWNKGYVDVKIGRYFRA
jgi:hypothetical protein